MSQTFDLDGAFTPIADKRKALEAVKAGGALYTAHVVYNGQILEHVWSGIDPDIADELLAEGSIRVSILWGRLLHRVAAELTDSGARLLGKRDKPAAKRRVKSKPTKKRRGKSKPN